MGYWTSENWMYSFAHNFFNHKTVPDAVSISWGWAEDQQCAAGIDQSECQTLGINSEQYVARVNTEFQKIGLRGVSLFVASGDSGANGRSDGTCTDKKLHASFPGSSPYVTAVGATMLSNPEFKLKNPPPACSAQGPNFACASGGTEVAVSVDQAGFTSGGGFSTYAPMPAYQKTAVDAYLKSGVELPPPSYYNNTHRAYPDIAAMGNNFLIYMQQMGGWSGVGGTSASTPTVAGVAAYLNDLSYAKKGKPLGFLNPLLYQMHAEMPEAFTDVTVGDNRCTEDGCFPSCKGYKATKGWDPVTGLGTPVADKMLAYVEKKLLDSKGLKVGTNPTHYGDPKNGCESDEQAVQVQGVSGDFCSPKCKNQVCPTDVPSRVTAKPTCALQSPTGASYCALICTPSAFRSNGANGECGTGTCESISGTGICTYATSELALAAPVVTELSTEIGTNPTHYGDPKTGCESDEKAVQVQGVSGDFCSPPCTSGPCPTDIPKGDTA